MQWSQNHPRKDVCSQFCPDTVLVCKSNLSFFKFCITTLKHLLHNLQAVAHLELPNTDFIFEVYLHVLMFPVCNWYLILWYFFIVAF